CVFPAGGVWSTPESTLDLPSNGRLAIVKIIDLSAPIAPTRPEAASFERVEICSTSHAGGAAQVEALFQVPPRLLRNGEGWAVEEFTSLATHGVTHVDAPWHYNSTIRGQRAATIDELPLEW